MCLATPLKIIKINGKKAMAAAHNHIHEVDLSLIKNPKIGNYIIAHNNIAINKISKNDAVKILKITDDSYYKPTPKFSEKKSLFNKNKRRKK